MKLDTKHLVEAIHNFSYFSHRFGSISKSGFTIVELLVVIVVIGILAAITVVSYTGINNRAIAVTLQSDLSAVSKKMQLFYVDYGKYPDTISTDCSASPDSTTNRCFRPSPGNDFTYSVNNSVSPQTYVIDAQHDSSGPVYRITESTAVSLTNGLAGIAATSGVTSVGSVLTAGTITPSGSTVNYQWQRADTSAGTYTNISGATSSTYTLVSADLGKYIKVVATGTGGFSGVFTSAATSVITTSIVSIAAISGTTSSGSVLNAGSVSPSGATVSYQWQRATTSTGTYANISGATASTYTLAIGDATYYIKVVATGTGIYTGSATSNATAAAVTTPITAVAAISGTTTVGQTLTAGALTPSGATASYQWQRATTSTGTYTNISGATAATYVLVAADANNFLKIVRTGTGSFTGSVTSAATAAAVRTPLTSIAAISGTTTVGQTLTAGALTPSGATVTYQWQSSATSGGTYANITGATSATRVLASTELGKFLKVVVTGTGNYTGTATSVATLAAVN